jgi:hypothetical protein
MKYSDSPSIINFHLHKEEWLKEMVTYEDKTLLFNLKCT